MYRVVIPLFFLYVTSADTVLNGTCSFTGVKEIDITKVVGTWHQQSRVENSDEIGECATTTIIKNNATYAISNREVVNGTVVFRNGTLDLKNVITHPNVFTATFNGSKTYDLAALATDSENYILLYGCNAVPNSNPAQKNVYAWLLTKSATLNSNYQNVMNETIQKHEDLKTVTFKNTDNSENACKVNGAGSINSSLVYLLLTIFILGKEFAH